MSSEAVSRLETLLARVVTRRAQPRPAPAPMAVSAVAPKPIAPEAPRVEARQPAIEAPTVEANVLELARHSKELMPEAPAVAEAPKPAAAKPIELKPAAPAAEAPKPAFEELDLDGPVEAPKPAAAAQAERPSEVPLAQAPAESTVVARRSLEPLSVAPPRTAAQAQPAAPKAPFTEDRIAASFAAGNAVAPGFGEDDADHIETLAFRVGRALPKAPQVPAPPLPVTSRDEPASARPERFTPSLPTAPVAAQIAAAPSTAASSLRSLLQRSVALRPRG